MDNKVEQPDASLPVSDLLEIDRICRRFEAEWNTGHHPKIDAFLRAAAEPLRNQLRKELLAIEAALRDGTRTADHRPSLEEFCERLSECGLMDADEIQQFIADRPAEQRPTTAEQLARAMFRRGRLTRFQAQAVFQGKTRGLVVGNYVVLDSLGKGGMGRVYKAQHRKMKRVVAIKMLPSSATKSSDAVKRFQREVEAAARLSHPNIVTAYDADEAQGVRFLVMEYVEGQDLAALVKARGPLPLADAVDLIMQAAKGLHYAHSEGVIHRDIKPSNMLLDKEGRLRILDMGLARMGDAVDVADDELTYSGQVMGTFDFMAPEQALDSHAVDARADIYSLGCTLYAILTGRAPYRGKTVGQKIVAHREQPIPSLRAVRADAPESLDAIFQKMLAKRPEHRQQSMSELLTQLQALALPQAPSPVVVPGGAQAYAETQSFHRESIDTTLNSILAAPLEELPLAGRTQQTQGTQGSPRQWPKLLSKRPKTAIAIAVGLLGFVVLLGTILAIRTMRGTLDSDIDAPNVIVQDLNGPKTPEKPAVTSITDATSPEEKSSATESQTEPGKPLTSPLSLPPLKLPPGSPPPAIAPFDVAKTKMAQDDIGVPETAGTGQRSVDEMAAAKKEAALVKYDQVRPTYPDTAEGQWSLALWCRDRSLEEQFKRHAERVIELAPDHINARQALGHAKIGGRWIAEDDAMRQGYVRYKGEWKLPREIERLEGPGEKDIAEKDWDAKLSRWTAAPHGDQKARENISDITDPAAVPALSKGMLVKRDRVAPEYRLLYVEALSKIKSPEAAMVLAMSAIDDSAEEVRLSCLDALEHKFEESNDKKMVVQYFVKRLDPKESNATISQAAIALGRIKDGAAVGPLINALLSRNSKTTSVRVPNRAVHDALVSITGQNFDFDERAWRTWLNAQKKP